MTQIKGIDVSHWQGLIDWGKVKGDGVVFAFIKATQGTSYSKESYFHDNAPKALEADIHVGAYHYATFGTVAEAKAEAAYFLSVVKSHKLRYPLVLDLEENKKGASRTVLTDAAIAFLEAIENAGYFAMLYSGKSFLENQLEESRLKPYALWVARYNTTLGRGADIWQYSSEGKVAGISGNTDMNWAYRDFAEEIAGQKTTSPTPILVAPAPSNDDDYLHIVSAGEVLSKIAAKYGVTVDYLVKLNGIADPDRIHVGQRLKLKGNVPASKPVAPQPVYYLVRSGDNLSKIAENNGTTVNQLVAWNGIKNKNLIYAGQKLRVK
jgi:lysozyme